MRYGACIRDSTGHFIAAATGNFITASMSVLEEEAARAILNALLWLTQNNLSSVISETNCKSVADRISNGEEDISEYRIYAWFLVK